MTTKQMLTWIGKCPSLLRRVSTDLLNKPMALIVFLSSFDMHSNHLSDITMNIKWTPCIHLSSLRLLLLEANSCCRAAFPLFNLNKLVSTWHGAVTWRCTYFPKEFSTHGACVGQHTGWSEFQWRFCRIPQLKWRWGPFTFNKYASN